MFFEIWRKLCSIEPIRLTMIFIIEGIMTIIVISVILFLFCNIVLPAYNFSVLYFTWEIYEYIYMNFDSRYNNDQVTRFVSKYTCPPMFLCRFFWNIFNVFALAFENNNAVTLFDFNWFNAFNVYYFYFFLSFFVIFTILSALLKINLFKYFSVSLLLNNIYLFFFNIFNKIEFTNFWLKIKNYFI